MFGRSMQRVAGIVVLILALTASSAVGDGSSRPARAVQAERRHQVQAVPPRPCRRTYRSALCPAEDHTVPCRSLLLGASSVESHLEVLPGGRAAAFSVRAGAGGLAGLAHVYLGSGSTSETLTVGLYEGQGRLPAALISTGSAALTTSGGWIAVTIKPITLIAHRKYWLAVLATGGSLRYRDEKHRPCGDVLSSQSTPRPYRQAGAPAERSAPAGRPSS